MPDGMKIEYESKWEEYVSTGRNKFNCSNCKEEIELPTFGFNHQYRCKCDNQNIAVGIVKKYIGRRFIVMNVRKVKI